MSQHTLNTDVNTALAALGSTMKGPGVPPAPLAGMLWLDDAAAPWTLRIYDGSNWIPVGTVDASSNVFIADGLAAGRFFAPRANDTPNMKLRLNAGIVFEPGPQTLTGVVSQETATLTAPTVNPRRDIVYIDRLTGILGVATGAEAASPVDPAIPAGKLPVARINWTVGATAVTTGMIDDIRVLNALGLGALAVQNFITDVPENFSLSGFLTPPTITATQNDYNPSNLATASTLRLSADAARSITGVAGGTAGRILIVHNIDAGNITLENEHAGSSAGNRFALNSDITLALNQAAILQYDNTSQRWRAIAYQPTGTAPGGLSRSLRFNSADSANLQRTLGTAVNSKVYTYSMWCKRAAISSGYHSMLSAHASGDVIGFTATDQLNFQYAGGSAANFYSNAGMFRDPSAWYHVVAAVDTTQATANNRVRFYVNGEELTSTQFSTYTQPSQNATSYFNTANSHHIGSDQSASTDFFSGYMTAIHFVDGQQLPPNAFGEFDDNGIWMPKEYEGIYGTNGFRLDFSDNSGTTSTTLGKDRSGNNNDWTPNNFSISAGPGNDSLIDVPVNFDDGGNGRGNYSTLNPLRTTGGTIANGALEFSNPTAGPYYAVAATQAMQVKTYWEIYRLSGSGQPYTGIIDDGELPTPGGSIAALIGGTANSWGSYQSTIWHNSVAVAASTDAGPGQTEMWAFDPATGKLWHGVDGAWDNSGDPATGTGQVGTADTTKPWFAATAGVDGYVACFNFGQRPFSYPVPAGFKALNTQNLPALAIAKPASYMNPVLYTGNGSTQTVSGVGFQPDLVWLKSRSNAFDHKLTDAIRGTTKGLESNTSDAESTDTNGLTTFTGGGFSLGNDATYNTNAATYVAWNWKTGVTPGFDILSYTGDGNSGRTVSHGLTVAPAFVIVKNRTDNSTDWAVWHKALANTEALNLNSAAVKFTATGYWNSTTPGASVLTLGNNAAVNANTKGYGAYLWAEVPGFSRFGSYTGNGSGDGPFVWCGFRPAYVMIKQVVGTAGVNATWSIIDATRDPINPTSKDIYADLSNADGATGIGDLVSNGFKLRVTGLFANESGATYIFAAFAEAPFKTARAR